MIAAVVPMKPLAHAKQRLSPVLPEAGRLALVRAMLRDVLATLRGCGEIAQTCVVTPDCEVAAIAAQFETGIVAENAAGGLDRAVASAARTLEERGAGTMLVLPGDVPLATSAEIDELASLARSCRMAIVPDRRRDGTNALLLSPPEAISTSFGPGSFARHLAAGRAAGLCPVVCPLEGIGRDIDDPDDLRFLVERTAGCAEYAFLHEAMRETIGKEPERA